MSLIDTFWQNSRYFGYLEIWNMKSRLNGKFRTVILIYTINQQWPFMRSSFQYRPNFDHGRLSNIKCLDLNWLLLIVLKYLMILLRFANFLKSSLFLIDFFSTSFFSEPSSFSPFLRFICWFIVHCWQPQANPFFFNRASNLFIQSNPLNFFPLIIIN